MAVLVVGAGPTGLTLACTLLSHGAPCRVIDRREGPAVQPKALVLWSGALEALRRVGIHEELVAAALPLGGASYWAGGKSLGRVRFGGLTGTAFPGPLCLPQPEVERMLYERLLALGGSVEWGVRLTDASVRPDGVVAELRRSDGSSEQATAAWLVGADGSRSQVRSALGIELGGRTYDRSFLLGDGILSGDAPRDEASYHLTPEGVLVMVPLPGGGHRVFFDVPPTDDETPPDTSLLQELLDARGPGGLRIERTWWTSRFRVHAKVATRFRQGRAFLAGDAAHSHSPAGGQGLNTGVQDGFDLGWKLAAVLSGADPALLDSYEAERRPAAVDAVGAADRQTKLWLARGPVAVAVRNTLMRQVARRGILERKIIPQIAQLDLDHSDSPAVSDLPGARRAPRRVRTGRRLPDALLRPVQSTAARTVHDHLAHGRHTILVVGDERGRELAAGAADLAADRGVPGVDVLWIRSAGSPDPAAGQLPASVAVAEDTAGTLIGASTWLAYVRPDGTVGARAGAGELERLLDLLPAAHASHTRSAISY